MARNLVNHPQYRWVVVAAATAGLAAAYGGISTISILIAPLEGEFNWRRADLSLAYTLLTIGAAFGGLVAGHLADRVSPRHVAMAGAAAIGVGMIVLSQLSSLRAMQGVYLTLGFVGFSSLVSPLLSTVALWFDRRAGLALGIASAGGALGQAIVPPVFQALVLGFGWRGACIALGLAYIALVLPAVALVRKPPLVRTAQAAGAGQRWPLPPTLSVALLGAAAVFCCMLMAVPSVHIVSLATEIGLSPTTSAALASVVMLAGAIGRVAAGVLADRVGALTAYAMVSALQTATVYLFLEAGSVPVLFVVAAVYGLGFGGVMTALVCAVREAVPQSRIARGMAATSLLAWIGMGVGGYQAGLCFDRTASYDLPFWNAAVSGLGNLAILAVLALLIRVAGRWRLPSLTALAQGPSRGTV